MLSVENLLAFCIALIPILLAILIAYLLYLIVL